MTQSNFLHVN